MVRFRDLEKRAEKGVGVRLERELRRRQGAGDGDISERAGCSGPGG
jgi:hypothetical protein